ncbi:MAG: 5'/3'-nucleotidase SurE [Thermogutta sp.]|nr:5'/3'-nucleotidase SurE [Thermogutta sp.]HOP78123.1 5'/3'-nucleotidase SurE [Thermogutta sp.]HPU06451.1 5'/3'-nucleotidase SurE [Thermogutta sp.]HQF13847.1 5'/3'-nucleotidase SurE [Thermogutta sp.]
MLILLTNDDGIYSPGLIALYEALQELGEVCVVAPATEQSGVGHSISYLRPLILKQVFHGDQHFGFAVDGSPADCVKLGVSELCPRRPDLVVSGINMGLNAGIAVLYSGTVAAAIEGAFFGILSVAVSLQFDDNPQFSRAARLAVQIIQQILKQRSDEVRLFNLNIPTKAVMDESPKVRVVSMDIRQYGEKYEKRVDPWGRTYYWATGEPSPTPEDRATDLSVLARGEIALTPLHYDLTAKSVLSKISEWEFPIRAEDVGSNVPGIPASVVVRTTHRLQSVIPSKDQ